MQLKCISDSHAALIVALENLIGSVNIAGAMGDDVELFNTVLPAAHAALREAKK